MRAVSLVAFLLSFSVCASTQTAPPRPPIIDMHLHAYPTDRWRLGTEPDGTPRRRPCFPEPCIHAAPSVEQPADILRLTLDAMNQHNIVLGVLSYPPPQVLEWKAADPERFMLGFYMVHPSDVSLPELRERFRSGEFQVLGELAFQYSDVAIDDPMLDPMFAMAAELDIPAHIHLGGGGGTKDFPIHLGNPLRLSTVLRKYPALRIYIENASWPFLEEITSLMYTYPNVYADLSTITWIIPREAFHRYLRGLVENGLSKRLMFGSDQMMWPETIPLAIEAVEAAKFLTTEQKRDIFCRNAARFLRLDPKTCD